MSGEWVGVLRKAPICDYNREHSQPGWFLSKSSCVSTGISRVLPPSPPFHFSSGRFNVSVLCTLTTSPLL